MTKKLQGKYRTEEQVKSEINRRYTSGESLKVVEIKREGEWMLYQKAREIFGNWETALRESGVKEEKIQELLKGKKYKDKESVIEALQRRIQDGKRMTSSELNSDRELTLYYTAVKMFGTWRAALEAAGMDMQTFKGNRKMKTISEKQDEVRGRIQERYHSGEGMRIRDLPGGIKNSLYKASERYFDSWKQAILESGIPVNEVDELLKGGKYATKESVIRGIQERMKENKGLRYIDVKNDGEQMLYTYGRKFFKTWDEALRKAGVPIDYQWDK